MKKRARIDRDFINDAKEKKEYAWTEIKNRCEEAVRRYVKEDKELQEEIISMTIVKLLEQINLFDPDRGKGEVEANFVQWINETVRLEFLHWHDKKKREEREIPVEEYVLSLGIQSDSADFDDKIEGVLSQDPYGIKKAQNDPELKLKLKEVIEAIKEFGDADIQKTNILHYVYGYTTKEIAEELGKKESTINTWIQRYKDKLRQHLKKKGIDENYFD
ncbi:MAG: sigma-70 family RNA polymerase sigma factor [Deltaproteobacteria bacterium]|nr:sigma-70 family RNA polymerase sigma factor [Deltaproteobacteria bacterium]